MALLPIEKQTPKVYSAFLYAYKANIVIASLRQSQLVASAHRRYRARFKADSITERVSAAALSHENSPALLSAENCNSDTLSRS